MRTKILLIFILSLFLINLASAEILLGQTKTIYSAGDNLILNLNVKSTSGNQGFLHVDLRCGNESETVLHVPLTLSAGESQNFDNNISLTKNFLNGMLGICYLEASFAGETDQSQNFEISDVLLVDLSVPKTELKAGDSLLVTGTAKRKNGDNANGYLDLSIKGTSLSARGLVENGKFYLNVNIPKDIESGSYILDVDVYEQDSNNEKSNEGRASITLRIMQVPAKIEVALTENSVNPGSNMSFMIFLYDQANKKIDADTSVDVTDSYNSVVWERITRTSELVVIPLDKNTSSGYWSVEAKYENLSVKRLFYVGENQEADFRIINDTLIVINMGNTPYRKAIQISIGDNVEIKQMDLDIGESVRYRLLAPDGLYKVSVSDGTKEINIGDVSLTGNVIGVMDVRRNVGLINQYPIVWLFLIVVFGLAIFLFVQRTSRKKTSFYETSSSKPVNVRKETKEKIVERSKVSGLVEGKIKAEYSLVAKGEKVEAGLVAVKLKNLNNINSETKQRLSSVFDSVSKAAVFNSQEFVVLVFSPNITRTFSNAMLATKAAIDIKEKLAGENIDFGIGVHAGEIISTIEGGKLKFTPLANNLGAVKKAAELADKDILITKDVHNKTMNEVKTTRFDLEGREFYKIDRVSDRGQYEDFISKFKQRYNQEKGGVERILPG